MEKLCEARAWVPSLAGGWRDAGGRPECLECLLLELQIAGGVASGCRHADVAQLVTNYREVDAGLKQRNSARVAQEVRPDFGRKARICIVD